MAFKDELRRLRKQDGMTQSELASRLGIAKSTISMYECGNREPDFETLEAIADFFNVDLNRLTGIGGSQYSLPSNIIPMPRMGSVPLIGEIACGVPVLAEENIEEYVDLPEHIKADFALRCKGDSMTGARINDGDIVYIRQQPTVANGDIAAVRIESEATLKRVYKNGDTVILQPENPAYPPMAFTGPALNEIAILGKAVAFTSIV